MDEQQRPRGLTAVTEARETRKRGHLAADPVTVLAVDGHGSRGLGVFYWKKTQGELESQKAGVFARQRAVEAELGPRFEPLRKAIEDWTVAAAGPYPGDRVDPAAKTWDFAGLPGIYLRLGMADATSAKSIRAASNDSLHDGFTACFFHVANPNPGAGAPCKMTHECPGGSFCNEIDHCAPAAQPYNMRAAYRGTRIMTNEWTVDLRAADSDMRMRLLEREFDGVVRDDVPLTIDLLTRAQFFLLVLDEDVAGPTSAAGAPDASTPHLEALQATAHAARVFLWKLKGDGDRELVRMRRDIDARFIPAGETTNTDPKIVAAQQRQANGCQLALSLREALSAK